jgi:hypothetical protein
LDCDIDALVETPEGEKLRVPAFWAGGDKFAFRYTAATPGLHSYRIEVAKGKAKTAADFSGNIVVSPYRGSNPFLKHGPLRLSDDGRHLAHADGTPFFFLADSWWHGMTSRLEWPGEFKKIVSIRKKMGFNAIQVCLSYACDMEMFDPRDANENGHGWEPGFRTINPSYFDLTDLRVIHLIEQGLLPSLVGTWGYAIHFMGIAKMRRHWRYLVARYGAFPVQFTLCGESRLPWYFSKNWGRDGFIQTQKWSKVLPYLRKINWSKRLLTVHAGPPLWFHDASYDPLSNMDQLDFYFGSGGGHSAEREHQQVTNSVRNLLNFKEKYGDKPAIISETAWENMDAGCGPRIQREQFWLSVLNGSPGFCYGADALWQMNSRRLPFGPSPLGFIWGNEPWEEAVHWKGSEHCAVGKRIMERFEWWRLEPHPEWIEPIAGKDDTILYAAAAGIPDGPRLYYLVFKQKPYKTSGLVPGSVHEAVFVSSLDGKEWPAGRIKADKEGCATLPPGPIRQDWALFLHPVK